MTRTRQLHNFPSTSQTRSNRSRPYARSRGRTQSRTVSHTQGQNYRPIESETHRHSRSRNDREKDRGGASEPQSSSPRLRRLGVRQAKDVAYNRSCSEDVGQQNSELSSTPTSEQADMIALLKQLSHESDIGVSPSNRQLKRLLEPKMKTSNGSDPLSHLKPLGRTEVLRCRCCSKMFLSYHGLDMHLESHDGHALRCWECDVRFSSNRSLSLHQRQRHGRKAQEEPGFHNLIFVDFSSDSFPAIARHYCETNSVQPTSHIHDYHCGACQRSFPINTALKLHNKHNHYTPSRYICQTCNVDYANKARLEQHKSSYAASGRKYMTDNKRVFVRSLSLIPTCMGESLEKKKLAPERNYVYYEKLREMGHVTENVYESEPLESEDETESSQS